LWGYVETEIIILKRCKISQWIFLRIKTVRLSDLHRCGRGRCSLHGAFLDRGRDRLSNGLWRAIEIFKIIKKCVEVVFIVVIICDHR
jgi:hypothetical protein